MVAATLLEDSWTAFVFVGTICEHTYLVQTRSTSHSAFMCLENILNFAAALNNHRYSRRAVPCCADSSVSWQM
jgi:hypothetical protein